MGVKNVFFFFFNVPREEDEVERFLSRVRHVDGPWGSPADALLEAGLRWVNLTCGATQGRLRFAFTSADERSSPGWRKNAFLKKKRV